MNRKGKKFISVGLIITCVFSLGACGNAENVSTENSSQNIELVEPVGATVSTEKPQYRNMYEYKVVPGFVCPKVTEYGYKTDQLFKDYASYPGQSIKKGTVLLLGDTEAIDKRIEDQEKKIKEMEESYAEDMKEMKENLYDPKRYEESYREALEELEKHKPNQYDVDAEGNTITTQEYAEWEAQYQQTDRIYRDYLITMQKLEAAISQREELYNLDHAYEQKKLDYLKKDRLFCVVSSGEEGDVVSMKELSREAKVYRNDPVVAVGDVSAKEIRCDYVNKAAVTGAEEVYAIVNGQRYEIEYQPIGAEEYKQLTQDGGKAYSTFTFVEDVPEIGCGDFVSIVMISQQRSNVLTVSKNAIYGDSTQKYVYVLEGNETVYTPVRIGMKNNMYVEILSGIDQDAQILSEVAVVKGGNEGKVSYGNVHMDYKATGYMYYPSREQVKCPVEYGTAYYDEVFVVANQEVQKGDVLCTIRVVADNISLERLQKRRQREIERLNDLHDDYKHDQENKYYLKTVKQKEEFIQELEKKISDMQKDFKVKEIKAPRNGVVTTVYRYNKDTLLYNGSVLFEICDENQAYIQVAEKGVVLNYGNVVDVAYKDLNGAQRNVQGKVATVSNMVLSKGMQSESMLIAIDPKDLENMAASTMNDNYWSRSKFEVTANVRNMDNVLLIPRKAVVEAAGQTFVKTKNDQGEIILTEFIAGGSDKENYWAVKGVTEGMIVCWE